MELDWIKTYRKEPETREKEQIIADLNAKVRRKEVKIEPFKNRMFFDEPTIVLCPHCNVEVNFVACGRPFLTCSNGAIELSLVRMILRRLHKNCVLKKF